MLRFLLQNIPRWHIFYTQHEESRGWQWSGMHRHLISHLGGTDSFPEIRKKVEVVLYRNKDCGKRRNFEKASSVSEYITSIPNIYNHKGEDSSLERHIHTPACLRRGISHNGDVNMIIVYGGRVHKSDKKSTCFHIKRGHLIRERHYLRTRNGSYRTLILVQRDWWFVGYLMTLNQLWNSLGRKTSLRI
jgi:hypothetical protein